MTNQDDVDQIKAQLKIVEKVMKKNCCFEFKKDGLLKKLYIVTIFKIVIHNYI